MTSDDHRMTPSTERVVFVGVDGQTAENVSQSETWSPDETFVFDGQHTYEVPTYSDDSHKIGVTTVRPIVTRRFVEDANNRVRLLGMDALYIRDTEVPKDLPDFGDRPSSQRHGLMRGARMLLHLILK